MKNPDWQLRSTRNWVGTQFHSSASDGYCPDSKRHQQCEMAALISTVIWFHFCTMWAVQKWYSSIFIYVSAQGLCNFRLITYLVKTTWGAINEVLTSLSCMKAATNCWCVMGSEETIQVQISKKQWICDLKACLVWSNPFEGGLGTMGTQWCDFIHWILFRYKTHTSIYTKKRVQDAPSHPSFLFSP